MLVSGLVDRFFDDEGVIVRRWLRGKTSLHAVMFALKNDIP